MYIVYDTLAKNYTKKHFSQYNCDDPFDCAFEYTQELLEKAKRNGKIYKPFKDTKNRYFYPYTCGDSHGKINAVVCEVR